MSAIEVPPSLPVRPKRDPWQATSSIGICRRASALLRRDRPGDPVAHLLADAIASAAEHHGAPEGSARAALAVQALRARMTDIARRIVANEARSAADKASA